ncbi:MAG TPA: hypothetical protein VHE12_03525 [bacterium]|nr:hypothetical protein [bacterium]
MKRLSLLLLPILLTGGFFLTGCPGNPPTSPNNPTNTPTGTITIVGTPTGTPTRTKTPICAPYYSFGKNVLGSGPLAPSGGIMVANKFNLPVYGNVFRLDVFLASAPVSATDIQMSIYTDNGGAPQSLIVASTQQAAVSGWNVLDTPQTILPSGDYWIAVTSPSSSSGINLSNDYGTTGDCHYTNASPGSLPAAFGAGSSTDWNFSMFADYCALAGSPTPDPTETFTFTPTATPTNTPTFTETVNSSCQGNYAFGNNFVGPSSVGIDNGSFATRAVLPVGATVTKLHCYITTTNGRHYKMGLYSDSGSGPGTLIAGSASLAAATGWNTADIPDTTLPAGTYWIAGSNADSGITPGPVFATQNYGDDATDGYSTFGIIPSTFSGSGPDSYTFDFYAEYCVLSGSPTPVPSVTWTFTPTATPTSTPTATQTPNLSCTGSYAFGNNFVGPSTTGIDNGSFASRYVLPVAGTVKNLHCYITTTNSRSLRMGIYSNSGSGPGTLIATSATLVAAVGWNTADIPDTPLPAGTYWIAAANDSSGSTPGPVFAMQDYDYDSSDGYASSSIIPSTFSGSGPVAYTFDFYADYCVVGASPTPVYTATWTFTPSYTPTFTPTITQTPACGGPTAFGINATQGSTSTFGGGNYLLSAFNLASGPVTVIRLNAYVASGTGNVRMALYTDNAGVPGTLKTQSNALPVTVGWNNFPVPGVALSAPATYWIGLIHDNYGTAMGFSYSSVTDHGYLQGGSITTFPGSMGSGINWDYVLSVYADKCP